MSQTGKLIPNLDQHNTKILNLTVPQRMDPVIKEILITDAHVTFYEFNVDLKQWTLWKTCADMFSQLAGISQAPASPFFGLWNMPTDSHKKMLYHMTLTGTKYDPIVGDLIALTKVKPKRIDDLARSNSPFPLAYVTDVINESPMTIQVLSSNDLIESSLCEMKERPKGFIVYLTNLTTNMHIWQALNPAANMNIVQTTLLPSSSVSTCYKVVSYFFFC
ncbi:putative mRNA-decapping enzyme subunit 1, PH-like domain superfamily [Helianthus anomalus]